MRGKARINVLFVTLRPGTVVMRCGKDQGTGRLGYHKHIRNLINRPDKHGSKTIARNRCLEMDKVFNETLW